MSKLGLPAPASRHGVSPAPIDIFLVSNQRRKPDRPPEEALLARFRERDDRGHFPISARTYGG